MTSTTLPMLEAYPFGIDLDLTLLASAIDALNDCAEACAGCASACRGLVRGMS